MNMEQKQSKIYVSSSEKGDTLARKLRDQLTSDFTLVILGKDWREQEGGATIIDRLEKTKDEFDFAVIILTRKDMIFQKNGDDEIPQALNNCFYEAGLFMGLLGPERSFLVSSIKRKDLPDELEGITIRNFDPVEELQDEKMCEKAMKTPASKILEYIQKKGPKQRMQPLPILSRDIIYERESKLNKFQVVVNAKQPSEAAEFKRAVQVKKNMDKNIYYKYFFYAETGGALSISQFLQNILIADLVKTEEDSTKTEDFIFRCEKIKNNSDEVLSILWDICNFGRLRIYFFQTIPSFEFCIHNADAPDAKAYIKYEENYIEWYEGQKANIFANNLWKQLEKCCLYEPSHAIFMNTRCLNILEQPIRDNLDLELNKHFGGISDLVKNICYRGWILPFSGGKGVGIDEKNTIVGKESSASATVSWIKLDEGTSWDKGNAAGKMILKNQMGTFQDEDLIVPGKPPDTTARVKGN